jgi:hypothetical protein
VRVPAGLQADELRGFAAHLKNRAHLGIERGHRLGDGAKLVFALDPQGLGDQARTRSGDADLGDVVFSNLTLKIPQKLERSPNWVAFDPPVMGQDRRPNFAATGLWQIFAKKTASRLAGQRCADRGQLYTDRPNIDPDANARMSPPCGQR